MSTTVSAPNTPNPGATNANVLGSMIQLAPQMFGAEQQFAPQYAQLFNGIISQSLLGNVNSGQFLQDHPEFNEGYQNALQQGGQGAAQSWLNQAIANAPYIDQASLPRTGGLLSTYSQSSPYVQTTQNQLNAQQAQGNLSNLQQYGGQAVSAFNAANPMQQQAQQGLLNTAGNAFNFGNVTAPNSPLGSLSSWGSPQMNVQGQNIQGASFGATPTVSSSTFGNIPQAQASWANSAGLGGVPLSQQANLGWNPMGAMMAANNNPVLGQLDQTAQSQLALGGQLSGQEVSQIGQNVLSQFNTMGRAQDPAAAAALALNLDSVQQQRLAQRESMAQQAAGLTQGQTAQQLQAQQLALGGAQTQAGFGQQAGLANQAALLQGGLFNAGNQQQANLFNAGNSQTSNLANQQALLQGGMFNATQQQQAALANQAAQQQAQTLNQQYSQQANIANQSAALQAALANQQAFMGQQGLQLQGGTTAANQQLQSQLANQQNYLAALGLQGGLYGQAANSYGGNTAAALGGILSPSNALSQTSGIYNQSGAPTGSQNFNPFGTGTSLYGQQYNAQNQANLTNATTNAGMIGGGLGLLGGIGGGLFQGAGAAGSFGALFCWVAREVYGAENPKWLRARAWMLTKAPAQLRELYSECGEYLAWRLASLPRLRAKLREQFDLILEMEGV